MILRGDIVHMESGAMTVQSSNIHTIRAPRQVLQPFSQGDRVLVHLPKASATSTDLEYSEGSRIFRDTFKHISDLRQDKYSDIIAMCTRFKPLAPTKGTDSVFSLGLLDHSGSVELKSFIKESDFRRLVAPGVAEDAAFTPGDILLLRNVKRGRLAGTAVIYKTCEIVRLESTHAVGDERRMYENLVAQFLGAYLGAQVVREKVLSPKTKRIEQIRDRSFFNVVGKVLYCDFDVAPTVCITDFTTNSIAEPGTGQFPSNAILAIKLFGRHAELSAKIQLNRHYFFANIRIHSFSPSLEAYMHDSLEGDVVLIESPELLREILEAEKRGISRPLHESGTDGEPIADGCEDTYGSGGREKVLGVAKLCQIKVPGIFLSSCLIRTVEFLESGEGTTSRVVVEEHTTLYDLVAKQKLTSKLLSIRNVLENRSYKCLVLRTGNSKLFMVDLFANDMEYRNFECFYLSS